MKPNELQHLLKDAKMIRVPISEEKTTIELDENLVMIPRLQYFDLVRKATLFDCLKDDIRVGLDEGESYPIDNDVVMAITGMNRYKAALMSEKNELKQKAEEDAKKIEAMSEELKKLKIVLDDTKAEREAAIAELRAIKDGDGKQEAKPNE